MNEEETKEVNQAEDKKDLDLMEIEVYRQFWRSLNVALNEIKELRGLEIEVDNGEVMKHEISTLKKELTELKNLLLKMQEQNTVNTPPQQIQQQIPAQRVPVIQQVAPSLPYYQTPNYAPMVPIIQQ